MQTKFSLYMPTRGVAEVECDRGFELMTLDNLIDGANGKNSTEFTESNSDRETPFLTIDSAEGNIHLRYAHGDFEKIRKEVKDYLEFRGVDQCAFVASDLGEETKEETKEEAKNEPEQEKETQEEEKKESVEEITEETVTAPVVKKTVKKAKK